MRIILNLQNSNFDSPLFSFTLFIYIYLIVSSLKRLTRRSPNSPKSFVYLSAPRSDTFFAWGLEGGDFLPVYKVSFIIVSPSPFSSPCPPTSCYRLKQLHRSLQFFTYIIISRKNCDSISRDMCCCLFCAKDVQICATHCAVL